MKEMLPYMNIYPTEAVTSTPEDTAEGDTTAEDTAAEDTAEDTANDNKVIVTETGRVIDGMHIDPEYAAANNLDPNTGESLDQESVLPDGYTGSADSEEDTVTKSEEAAMTGE